LRGPLGNKRKGGAPPFSFLFFFLKLKMKRYYKPRLVH
jgi:hypothetical protein